ncbi:MAG: hypothetical protein K5928_06245 [Prevotella sp.]|nr:hypothetical protein [Prevotella sp.]
MKTVKLAGIFIVMAAVIFGAVLWMNGGSNKSDTFVDEDLVDVAEKCDEIRSAWNEVSGWDKDVYTDMREDVAQDSALSLYSMDGYQTVRSTLREEAVNKVCDALAQQLKADKFSHQAVEQEYQGVDYLKRAENIAQDARIKRAEQLHQLYVNIRQFVGSNHAITPRFDAAKASWNAFAASAQAVLGRAKQLRENPLFGEMNTIPGFKDGLDEAKLKPQVMNQRNGFYRSLSQQIVKHFAQAEHTQENLSLFQQAYDKYKSEELNIGINELAQQFRLFKKQCEQQAAPAPSNND